MGTEDIFERFTPVKVLIKNREALRSDYVPGDLPHRESDIIRLAQIWSPLLGNENAGNVLIYGYPGTGKTAVVKLVLSKLRSTINGLSNATLPVRPTLVYVNTRLAGTPYRVTRELCLKFSIDAPLRGLHSSDLFERFLLHIAELNKQVLLVLDEVDSLAKEMMDTQLLYQLYRINEFLDDKDSSTRMSICGITNDMRFKDYLDSRVLSSLSSGELLFHPYTADEIHDILKARALIAFSEGAVSQGALGLISALAASEHGDARRAIDLLRVAGEIAEIKGADKVLDSHVREAEKEIEETKVKELVLGLPLHQRIALTSIFLAKKLPTSLGDLYDSYVDICSSSKLTPLTQRRLSQIINELDTLGLISSRLIYVGRGGRTKNVSLAVSPKVLKEILERDARIAEFLAKK